MSNFKKAMAAAMAEQSNEDNTETIAFDAKEIKTDSNIQNVFFFTAK